MINVVIGSHKRFERVETVIEYSIRKHTNSNVNIIIARPEYYGLPDTGCTGFSNIRFYVPDILGNKGFGIYLDVDMLLVSDISELYEYRQKGKYVCMRDGSTEVAVICCESQKIKEPYERRKWFHEPHLNKSCVIPQCWNVEDRVTPEAKLIHYTNLDTQPWFYDHPNKEAAELWFEYERLRS